MDILRTLPDNKLIRDDDSIVSIFQLRSVTHYEANLPEPTGEFEAYDGKIVRFSYAKEFVQQISFSSALSIE